MTINSNISNLTNNINSNINPTKILCILDGFGLNVNSHNNCASQAKMPNLRRLMSQYHWSGLNADGDNVGQESGLVGNSEVGHMNIGGMKLVPQLSFQITKNAENNFDFNPVIAPDQLFDPKLFLKKSWQNKTPEDLKTIHLIGLFSTGCIHSDLRHWASSIATAGQSGATRIVLHIICDGRDSDKKSFLATWQYFTQQYQDQLKPLEDKIFLGSVGGRFFAMDRDQNMDRVGVALAPWLAHAVVAQSSKNPELGSFADFVQAQYGDSTLAKTQELMTKNTDSLKTILSYSHDESMAKSLADYKGISFGAIDAFISEYSQLNYQSGIFDENILPACLQFILPSDTIWLVNFRTDRMKQLAQMLCCVNQKFQLNLMILSMNDYCVDFEGYLNQDLEEVRHKSNVRYYPVFKNKPVVNTLAETIAGFEQTQLHIAETEKYAHVTYFFNGGQDKKSVGEDWMVIPSNKVQSHAQIPEMKAKEITDYILSSLKYSDNSNNTQSDFDYYLDKLCNDIDQSLLEPQKIVIGKLASNLSKKINLDFQPNIVFVSGSRGYGWSHNTKHHKEISILEYSNILLHTVFNQNANIFQSKKDTRKYLVVAPLDSKFEKFSLCRYFVDCKDIKLVSVWNATKKYIIDNIKDEELDDYFDQQKQPLWGEATSPIPILDGLSSGLSGVQRSYDKSNSQVVNSQAKPYNYIIVNYANPDMVGHTGDIGAGIQSMEFLDEQIGRLAQEVELGGHSMVIIADHGNIEFVGGFKKNGKNLTDTEHNPNSVPCIIVDSRLRKNANDKANLNFIFENLKSKQITFEDSVINKAFEFQSSADYSNNWLTQEEVQSLENLRMPLWYAGVILMGL